MAYLHLITIIDGWNFLIWLKLKSITCKLSKQMKVNGWRTLILFQEKLIIFKQIKLLNKFKSISFRRLLRKWISSKLLKLVNVHSCKWSIKLLSKLIVFKQANPLNIF